MEFHSSTLSYNTYTYTYICVYSLQQSRHRCSIPSMCSLLNISLSTMEKHSLFCHCLVLVHHLLWINLHKLITLSLRKQKTTCLYLADVIALYGFRSILFVVCGYWYSVFLGTFSVVGLVYKKCPKTPYGFGAMVFQNHMFSLFVVLVIINALHISLSCHARDINSH